MVLSIGILSCLYVSVGVYERNHHHWGVTTSLWPWPFWVLPATLFAVMSLVNSTVRHAFPLCFIWGDIGNHWCKVEVWTKHWMLSSNFHKVYRGKTLKLIPPFVWIYVMRGLSDKGEDFPYFYANHFSIVWCDTFYVLNRENFNFLCEG